MYHSLNSNENKSIVWGQTPLGKSQALADPDAEGSGCVSHSWPWGQGLLEITSPPPICRREGALTGQARPGQAGETRPGMVSMRTVRAESLTPPTQKVLRGYGGAAVSMASDVSSSGSYVGGVSLNGDPGRWMILVSGRKGLHT